MFFQLTSFSTRSMDRQLLMTHSCGMMTKTLYLFKFLGLFYTWQCTVAWQESTGRIAFEVPKHGTRRYIAISGDFRGLDITLYACYFS